MNTVTTKITGFFHETDNLWDIVVVGPFGVAVPNCGIASSASMTLLGNTSLDGTIQVPLCQGEKLIALKKDLLHDKTEIAGNRSLRIIMRASY